MIDFLDVKLISFGEYTLNLYNLFFLGVIIVISVILQSLFKALIYRFSNLDISKKFSIYKLFQYVFWIIIILLMMQVLGINISLFLAGSAALLVGLGLGMQNIFSDFVSGIVLLLDGTLKVGDIIEVNNNVYRVESINFRTTSVIGRRENYVILPNSELTQNKVINWTYSEKLSRFRVEVGVDYSSDVELVMKILKESANKQPQVEKKEETLVRFDDYADSALIFSVLFWSNEVFRIERIKSDIRVDIFRAFKENNITIPFPQRVVHINK